MASASALPPSGEVAWHGPSGAGDPGRPVVILVHGRGQLPGDSAGVRAEWSRVLRTATAELAGAELLQDGDVWLAWYADALDPLAPAACAGARDSLKTAGSGTAEDQSLRGVFAAVGEGLSGALDLFDGYARDEVRALAGDLLFLGDPVRRCSAERQLAVALVRASEQGRPVILVAHSFGSLLSYGYLARQAPGEPPVAGVERFVTIGSLLGAPGARRLLLADTASRPSVPAGVGGWTNIVDVRDALAYPIEFGADTVGGRVQNLTTTSSAPGADPHYVLRYLRDPVTVRTVARAWCEAHEAGRGRGEPVACAAVVAR
ncbi:MAG TPA: hypothetical protein VK922_07010 [Gemmatimonadaceae bacterium]|nr:hypothetical protein [Gemmatimonadaceae bacterium]